MVWLAEADAALRLCAALAQVIPDWRTGPVQHSLETPIRQRIFQIACGYEDQDDADAPRSDPLLKLVCGRLPDEPDLASQPTLSRLENAIDFKTCYRLAVALLGIYLQERGRSGWPIRILIDADSTDDPTHGEQEGGACHGYYRQDMLHPLLLTDGETDQPITAILRPGTCHASRGIVPILQRVIGAIRARWPEVVVEFRGDSGFAVPELYAYLEAEQIPYTITLITNDRLRAMAADLLAEAKQQYDRTGQKVRRFGEGRYAADSWPHERRVVHKAERLAKGPNVRFAVTSRTEEPEALYTWYVQRGGSPEGCIKDVKAGCFLDRLSDHRFWANQFQLVLHSAASCMPPDAGAPVPTTSYTPSNGSRAARLRVRVARGVLTSDNEERLSRFARRSEEPRRSRIRRPAACPDHQRGRPPQALVAIPGDACVSVVRMRPFVKPFLSGRYAEGSWAGLFCDRLRASGCPT